MSNLPRRKSPLPVQQTQKLFVGAHNQTLSVAAIGVNNPDRSPI
jgi:hypothetical protein